MNGVASNRLTKIVCSAPVILLALYFCFPIGVILLILRIILLGAVHYLRAPIAIVIVTVLIRCFVSLQEIFHFPIPYINEILTSPICEFIIAHNTSVMIAASVAIILALLFRKAIARFNGLISQFFHAKMAAETSIAQENDLKLKEKVITSSQSTPHVVKCTNCGATNHITGTVGKCKSCRTPIEYHGKV